MPLNRALRITPHQALIREMILQLKKGWLDAGYFRDKFDAEILQMWAPAWKEFAENDWLSVEGDRIELTQSAVVLENLIGQLLFSKTAE